MPTSSPRLFTSARAADRLEASLAWLKERAPAEPLLILGPTWDAAVGLARQATRHHQATLGWHRSTLHRLASEAALPGLAGRGLAPASSLAIEAVCARVVHRLGERAELGRFAAVADLPGLPRALARTLTEVRLAGLGAEALPVDLGRALSVYVAELAAAALADRADTLRHATVAVAAGESQHEGLPVLLLDLSVAHVLEAELLRALIGRAPRVFATQPAGDGDRLAAALGVQPEALPVVGEGALVRLQQQLFSAAHPEPGELGGEVALLSAPGETRECTEIARRIHLAAGEGVPFDRMAVLLHVPGAYRAPLVEALRRGGIPVWAAGASRAPDPGGRALLALLACKAEGLSARAFAEYLSLGETPGRDAEGAPPAALSERFVAPDEELAAGRLAEAAEAAEVDHEQEPPTPLAEPREWERMLVDAAVIGGIERWERRLAGLREQLQVESDSLDAHDPRWSQRQRTMSALGELQAFAMPLLRDLEALSESGTWGSWIEGLGALATRALRDPTRVLSVLSELRPMGTLGPVSLREVRQVLTPRLTELLERDGGRRYGKVFVGGIDAARGLCFDRAFVPGLAEGIFPRKVVEDPLLLDAQREQLGLPTHRRRAALQREALQLAVGAASQRVMLSWPRIDLDKGRPRVPSFYGLEVVRAAEGQLPSFEELAHRAEQVGDARLGWPAPRDPAAALDAAEHDLSVLAAARDDDATARGTANYLLETNVHLARALRARGRRWKVKRFTPADGLIQPGAEAKEALAAHQLSARSFSATSLQQFADCPYRFLLHTIHRLAPREEPVAVERLDPMQRGSLIHQVHFEVLCALREEGALPVTAESLDAALVRLDTVLQGVAARWRDTLAPAIDRVWDDAIAQMRSDLREWLRRSVDEPRWVPWRFELAFGLRRGGDRDPHSQDEAALLDNGLSLRGSIDLVERRADGAVRATDFKTGKASTPKGMIVAGGTALQPVLYALALEKILPAATVEEGRLYYSTSRGAYEDRVVPLGPAVRKVADRVVAVVADHLAEGRFVAAPKEGACKWCDDQAVCGPWEELRTSNKPRIRDLDSIRSEP